MSKCILETQYRARYIHSSVISLDFLTRKTIFKTFHIKYLQKINDNIYIKIVPVCFSVSLFMGHVLLCFIRMPSGLVRV